MSLATILILIMIGIMAGVFGGLFGIGGGLIMIPALVFFLNTDQHLAQGTSLAVMLPPIGLLAAYNYYKAGQVNIWYAVIIATAFIAGGYFGSKIALNLSETTMKRVFGVFLLLYALKLIFTKQPAISD
jgi:uncharacterized protein